jgi:threonylcarbamoyladenosine tRNA methylthiotransferase MtaB
VAAPAERADLVVVNTCSVTASADQGARQTIRRIARVNPHARIVVTGCYATRESRQVSELPNVAHVIANDDKPRLITLVRSSLSSGAGAGMTSSDVPGHAQGRKELGDAPRGELTTSERFGAGEGSCGAALEPGIAGRTAFTLRVQTGCAEPCSYCIIPETRGAPRRAPLRQVLTEVDRIVASGFKEIALTGVHLGSYGRDLDDRSSLLELLSSLRDRFEYGSNPSVLFRISSLEPMDCTPEIVRLVRESTCFAPHFHLPLQHASARLLRAMRRPYELDRYAALVDDIRRGIPNASIGSDVIVGFPGETDEDFDTLAEYLARSPLTHLHVFPYSDRPGTAASAMGDRPSGTVVKERGARVRAIGAALTRRFVQSQLGTRHRALTLEDGTLAVTGNYLKVRIPPGRPRNEWVTLRVVSTEPVMQGELV